MGSYITECVDEPCQIALVASRSQQGLTLFVVVMGLFVIAFHTSHFPQIVEDKRQAPFLTQLLVYGIRLVQPTLRLIRVSESQRYVTEVHKCCGMKK